jgi:hypothetical protein
MRHRAGYTGLNVEFILQTHGMQAHVLPGMPDMPDTKERPNMKPVLTET